MAKKVRTEGAAAPALDAQRREAEQLQAIGRLAGGVAHDFNNLLTSINGFAQLVLEDLPSDHPSVDDIKEILGAGQRAAELTNQLLAFSQRQILQPQVVDVGTLINSCAARLRKLLGDQIDVVVVLDRTPQSVSVDPAQFEQVLSNLATSAREAMPESGRFSIETSPEVFDDTYVGAHLGARRGRHVAIAVSDTGPGIDDETQAHLFEPFFTTKTHGKGAGLGLATVYGIVTQSGGHVTAEAGAGGGTTFRIYLPEVDAEARADVPAPRATAERPRGSETILLVDDEDSVRQLASQLLRKSGYTVIEAADGPAAVRLCRDLPRPVDLLLTDVVMPRMNGRELAAEVNALCPALKVLYMSGFADHAIVHDGILDAGLAFLPKPLTMDTLTRKVRDVLDA